jgi:uroporphyrinogen-III synthase
MTTSNSSAAQAASVASIDGLNLSLPDDSGSNLSDVSNQPLRVCSFESRKQSEMRSLIERHGGQATIAPSLREVALADNVAVFGFLDRLLAQEVHAVLFMTGVGAKALLEVIETRLDRARFFQALQDCCVIVRGPKPTAVLREWGVRIDHRAPEPNTWRELLSVIDAGLLFPVGVQSLAERRSEKWESEALAEPQMGEKHRSAGALPSRNLASGIISESAVADLRHRTIAIQEYGQPSHELYAALNERGAEVLPVPVYRWELPEETAPLEAAIREIVAGCFDVLLLTSAQQIRNAIEIADRLGLREPFLAAANRLMVGSIGPTCSEALRDAGLKVDLEPTHPHMGHLVRESLELARQRLSQI